MLKAIDKLLLWVCGLGVCNSMKDVPGVVRVALEFDDAEAFHAAIGAALREVPKGERNPHWVGLRTFCFYVQGNAVELRNTSKQELRPKGKLGYAPRAMPFETWMH
jgi:hypothetical protein